LEAHDDSEIIYMTKIIEDQKNHLVNFNPHIQLPEISMAVMLRETSYEKLEKLLT
jgi:hypothetical protein